VAEFTGIGGSFALEYAVGIAIPIAPFVLGFEGIVLYFYLIIGIAIFIVGNMTDYQEQS